MIFNNHSAYDGEHAFLGASRFHWINYDNEKVVEAYSSFIAAQKGVVLHDFAAQCIRLGQKLPRSQTTLNMYVNDAIGFKMKPEQILFYSTNSFGTADSISFRNNQLRIHDLKTGTTPAYIEQLLVYAALFCLEYRMVPDKMMIELRIYQLDKIFTYAPQAEEIEDIMHKIVEFDKIISKVKIEEE